MYVPMIGTTIVCCATTADSEWSAMLLVDESCRYYMHGIVK